MTTKITVEEALKIPSDEVIFVDTRSPKEFEEDNIPGSISIPLFSNEERKIIGTLYKNNQVEAYRTGFDIYNGKILAFIDQFKRLDPDKKIIIYCWRGGMRSKTVTDLIENVRPEVFQLEKGYKKYREHVRSRLEGFEYGFEMIVLQGLAGNGKTDLIKKIQPSIDLEGFAKHRSSLFGAIGLKPVSQKKFESRLWERLERIKDEKIVFVEGESRKIGNLFIPEKMFEKMQSSKTILVKASMESRAKRIVRDYFSHGEDEKIKEIITDLKAKIGKKMVSELVELVDSRDYETVSKILLEEYYDPQYRHVMDNKEYIKEIESDDIDLAVKEIEKIRSEK